MNNKKTLLKRLSELPFIRSPVTLAALGFGGYYLIDLWRTAANYLELSTGAFWSTNAAVCLPILGTIWHSYKRRITQGERLEGFFEKDELMRRPENRLGYSDRMAYILAEMSELAYYEVEKYDDIVAQLFEDAKKEFPEAKNTELINKFIESYRSQFRLSETMGEEEQFESLLKKKNFVFIKPYLNVGPSQGFVCVYKKAGEIPYIVVAFRGSEKKVDDWLTNADALPITKLVEGGEEKVHSGFYGNFENFRETLEPLISKAKTEARRGSNLKGDIPIFFTGHSLGGALAMITTKEIYPDGAGATYTFGAPRLGNYDYFRNVKTPIYRVVNSSDIVPRVPPGAWVSIIVAVIGGLRYLLVTIKPVDRILMYIEGWADKLKDYRHFGDLRYLTDSAGGDFDDVEILTNPSSFDRVRWFWRHLMVSIGMPVKSHSMQLYRNKLTKLAEKRNQASPAQTQAPTPTNEITYGEDEDTAVDSTSSSEEEVVT